MKKLYPLKFVPTLIDKIWGSEALLISDNEDSPSVAENGFLAENDIADILETYLGDFVGDEIFEYYNLQFPLSVKLLHADGNVSAHVHPDDEIAMERYYSYGKTEFLYVLDASPQARMYLGFNRAINATELYEACLNGTLPSLMNVFQPKKGDCFCIEAGTVHSLGGGLTVLEVSQPSDITFRLYDWGREGGSDPSREILLEEALDLIDYRRLDETSCRMPRGGCNLFSGKHFSVSEHSLDKPLTVAPERSGSVIVMACTQGKANAVYGKEVISFTKGEALLIPASLDEFEICRDGNEGRVIRITVPKKSIDEDAYYDPLSEESDNGQREN
ncbi:MAG: hypothetical protein KBT00_00440 [Bacteroidales bacterium]|nr:hypothetical protein [Candidatus Cacconaster merdequi]